MKQKFKIPSMSAPASNRDLQTDFQTLDTRMMNNFNVAIESDDKKRRRSARGFMSKFMDDEPDNSRRFPKLWAAMCVELRHQTSNTTTPISQTHKILKAAGYTSETILRFEQQNQTTGESK
ncbi:MAG: hypothetical protein ABJO86_00825 [Lentilitoribacter sp.]